VARQESTGDKKGRRRPQLKVFFLNGDLHRKIEINRGKDIIVAWNYTKGRKMTYSYTDVLRRKQTAFPTKEVSQILNRSVLSLELAITNGSIKRPQYTYNIFDPDKKVSGFFWTEKDILDALDYFASLHRGRPRKDGGITAASDLPTPREVRAMMNNEQILYVKDGDKFIQSWKAKEFL
jgi:hypothetical protein